MAALPDPTPRDPTTRAASRTQLEAIVDRVRPLTLSEQRLLPVVEPLASLLPDAGLRRGTLLSVGGAGAATSLALALGAGPSAAGSWVAAVGIPHLGLVAAAELGVSLDRLALVAPPEPRRWATVVAALLDAFDVVLVHPPRRLPAADARRLSARARERGAVLLALGEVLEGSEVRLEVVGSTWFGVGAGDGHLRARQVEVRVTGRRAAARPRRARLWLPDPDGGIALVTAPAAPEQHETGRRTVVPFPGRGVTLHDGVHAR